MRGFRKFENGNKAAPQGREVGVCRWRAIVVWTERVLLVSGVALVIFYGAARIEGCLTSRAALKQFAEADGFSNPQVVGRTENQVSDDVSGSAEQMELPNVDFRLWGERRIKAYQYAANQQAETPLAVLRIPKIQLEAPLFDGTDELTLNHGVGRIVGTTHPDGAGNIGIAGHRDGFFRGLKDVSVGDAIELKTLKGTATYIVDQIQIVSPRQVEVLQPTSVPSVTLVTCYPFYFIGSAPQRYIVTASLSSEKDAPEKIGEPETVRPQRAGNCR